MIFSNCLINVRIFTANNPARHIVLIFFCKFASKSWQCISSPTLAHKTLCCVENDTAEATWDGRSQAGLHPPCGFCVFTTTCAKEQYNILTTKLQNKKSCSNSRNCCCKYWARAQQGLKFKGCSASLLGREASFTIFKKKRPGNLTKTKTQGYRPK